MPCKTLKWSLLRYPHRADVVGSVALNLFTKSVVEAAALEWFVALAYAVLLDGKGARPRPHAHLCPLHPAPIRLSARQAGAGHPDSPPASRAAFGELGRLRSRAEWSSAGTSLGNLKAPRGLAVDAAGRLYLADTGNTRILVFTPSAGR
jgi:hypothetical protein